MPYLRPGTRKELETRHAVRSGELNYKITLLAKQYLETNGLSYLSINDILGALEGAKLEFYRRVVVPYEDEKILENGDIF